MNEKLDPYFERRLEKARYHRVIRSIEVKSPLKETEPKKELANITIEGAITEFGWSEKSVANIIDALEREWIKITRIGKDRIRIEFLPIQNLPEQLGHVSELAAIEYNLKRGGVFGSQRPDKYTYLQTPDFAVEGYMDDEYEGKIYGRLFINSRKLAEKRNIYLDPESLHITDYEYGHGYCVQMGIPFEAISKIDVIQAKKIPIESRDYPDTSDWPEDAEQHINQQAQKLRQYLDKKLGNEKI